MRMEKEDLVSRAPFAGDNRVIEVFITDKGKSLLKELRILADDVYSQAFDGISDQDVITFTNILMRLRQNLS